jgi:hypothetical protein
MVKELSTALQKVWDLHNYLDANLDEVKLKQLSFVELSDDLNKIYSQIKEYKFLLEEHLENMGE